MCKISLIIPHFNSPQTLNILLSSIPKTDEIQVIVVDDNSTKHLQAYDSVKQQHSNVLFLTNITSTKGAGAARNVGLRAATGQWLLFADADDYFLTDWYTLVRPHCDSDADLIYFTPTSAILTTGEPSNRHILYEQMVSDYVTDSTSLHAETVLRYDFSVPWSKLVRHSMVIKHNLSFSETMVANDVMFSTKCGHFATKIEAVEQTIYCVTKSEGTLVTLATAEALLTRVDIHAQRYVYLRDVLPKAVFSMLHFDNRVFLHRSIAYKLGLKTHLKIALTFLKNRMPLFQKSDLKKLPFLKK